MWRLSLLSLLVCLLISGCESQSEATEDFSPGSRVFTTTNFEKAQEQTPFRILIPKFQVLDSLMKEDSTSVPKLKIEGTLKKSRKSELDDMLFILYWRPDQLSIPEKRVVIVESNREGFQIDPNRSQTKIKSTEVSYRKSVDGNEENTLFQLKCGEVYVSIELVNLPFDSGVNLIDSMLPNRCN